MRTSTRKNQLGAALVVIAFFLSGGAGAKTGKLDGGCSFEGHQLYGKIQVVKSFPDVKVKVVEHFPDLKVKVVEHFPNACGKWQMVESFPDTKVQFVASFPDVEIEYVESFPGKVR